MRIEVDEVVWLEEQVLSGSELAELSGLAPPTLAELVASGAIEPLEPPESGGGEARFGARALTAARRARRLEQDFELDAAALSLVLGLWERVSELEAQLRALQARLPRRAL